MARSDLLISLIKAGKDSPNPRFRQAVEALIAEERAKKHSILADQMAAAFTNGSNGQQPPVTSSPSSIVDLIYEVTSERTLESLVLPIAVVKECRSFIEEHQRADLLRSYGLAPRHKILLVGPPGNGKTSLAEVFAHELMIPMLSIRYEGIIGSYLGETASRLRKVFDYARQRACLLFFDEFETLGKERGDEHETGEIKRVVSTLLLQIDALPSNVIVVTATNHRELLDRAVWRRFQLRLELPRPTQQQALDFVRRLLGQFEFGKGIQTGALAKTLQGASYSEIEEFMVGLARRYVLGLPNINVNRLLQEQLEAWKAKAFSKTSLS